MLVLFLCVLQAMYLLFSFGVAGLYVGEVVFFAFVGIKEGIGQATWALILIFVTMAWHYLVSQGKGHSCL